MWNGEHTYDDPLVVCRHRMQRLGYPLSRDSLKGGFGLLRAGLGPMPGLSIGTFNGRKGDLQYLRWVNKDECGVRIFLEEPKHGNLWMVRTLRGGDYCSPYLVNYTLSGGRWCRNCKIYELGMEHGGSMGPPMTCEPSARALIASAW